MTEPALEPPPVINFAIPRANGRNGRLVSWQRQDWYVFEVLTGTRLAFKLTRESAARLEGELVVCEAQTSEESDVTFQPFIALPLAPQHAEGVALTRVAQYPKIPSAHAEGQCAADPTTANRWPSDRSSDLAMLGPSWIAVARGPDGVRLLDVSGADQGLIEERAHLRALPGDDYNDVAALSETILAVASRNRGLLLFDLSDPSVPVLIDESLPSISPRDGHNLFVAEDTLYLAQAPLHGTGAVATFDVSEPSRPAIRWRSHLADGHDAHDVFVAGQVAYVASLRGGLYTLDVKSGDVLMHLPASGVHSSALLPSHDGYSRLLFTEEKVAGKLKLLTFPPGDLSQASTETIAQHWSEDVHDTSRPSLIESAATPHKLQCIGDLCFIAFYQLGLRVLDFGQDDAFPVLRASFASWSPSPLGESNWLQGATGVIVDLPWIYVLDTCAGLLALRAPE